MDLLKLVCECEEMSAAMFQESRAADGQDGMAPCASPGFLYGRAGRALAAAAEILKKQLPAPTATPVGDKPPEQPSAPDAKAETTKKGK